MSIKTLGWLTAGVLKLIQKVNPVQFVVNHLKNVSVNFYFSINGMATVFTECI